MLSPTLSVPRHDGRSSRFIATIPTVGDAIEALNDLCRDLSATLKQIIDLWAELSSPDLIRVDHIQEVQLILGVSRAYTLMQSLLPPLQIVNIPDPAFIQDLDTAQKRLLISQEYSRLRERSQDEARTALSTMEMLLLLLWRHLAAYTEQDAAQLTTPQLPSLRASMRPLSAPDVDSFKAEVGKRLVGPLMRVSSLDLVSDASVIVWTGQTYGNAIRIRKPLGQNGSLIRGILRLCLEDSGIRLGCMVYLHR